MWGLQQYGVDILVFIRVVHVVKSAFKCTGWILTCLLFKDLPRCKLILKMGTVGDRLYRGRLIITMILHSADNDFFCICVQGNITLRHAKHAVNNSKRYNGVAILRCTYQLRFLHNAIATRLKSCGFVSLWRRIQIITGWILIGMIFTVA